MTIAAKIREALGAVHPGGLTLEQLCDKTRVPQKKLPGNLAPFVKRGEISVKPDGEGKPRYHLNAEYKKGRAAGSGKPPKKPRKDGTRRGADKDTPPPPAPAVDQARPYKAIADKLAASKPAPVEKLRSIILENLMTAGADLRRTLHENIENLEDDDGLMAAIRQHERAEQFYRDSLGA